jgi:hypothetical protein
MNIEYSYYFGMINMFMINNLKILNDKSEIKYCCYHFACILKLPLIVGRPVVLLHYILAIGLCLFSTQQRLHYAGCTECRGEAASLPRRFMGSTQ